MIKVAIIGFGVVGSGVADMICDNKDILKENTGHEIILGRIIDIRTFPQSRHGKLVTANAEEVFNDPSINIVVETMGGTKYSLDYTTKALKAKKHVITSNKELVAAHGPELLKLADENGVRYLFEASAGGGIPIVKTLSSCLAGNNIKEIYGILNGTTNYILTQMKETGKSFEVALKEAKEKGYAEADPTSDIEGHDAVRKIAILSSVAYNRFVDYKDLLCEGITKITTEDIRLANELGYEIKLIGYAKKDENGIIARVSPMLIPRSNLLAQVNDVFNAVMVKGDFIGESMYYGRGAGKDATASAVIGDIIDIAINPYAGMKSLWDIKAEKFAEKSNTKTAFFIRYEGSKEQAYITEEVRENELNKIIEERNLNVKNIIRVMKEHN